MQTHSKLQVYTNIQAWEAEAASVAVRWAQESVPAAQVPTVCQTINRIAKVSKAASGQVEAELVQSLISQELAAQGEETSLLFQTFNRTRLSEQ